MDRNSPEYKQWLKSLKVDDEVAVARYSNAVARYSLSRVTKITPTGRIKLHTASSDFYVPETGNSSNVYDHSSIVPVTDEVHEAMAAATVRRSIYDQINKISPRTFSKTDLEGLKALDEALRTAIGN